MATLIRSLTNSSSVNALVIKADGYDTTEVVSIPASGTLDLLIVLPVEQLHSMQAELAVLVAASQATVAATIDSSVLYEGAILSWILANDTQVVFVPTTASATHTAGATSVLHVENAAGATDIFDNATTITVSATPGGATTPLINGHASPQTLTVNKGVATVLITSSGADTITCAITANSRSLTQSSTFVATLS